MKLPSARGLGEAVKSVCLGDSLPTRRLTIPKRPEESHVDAKLRVLTRYIVASFPEASILSREIGGRYHLFVLVPFAGGPDKVIQVDRAVLADPTLPEKEFVTRIDQLHLPTLLRRCGRYDLQPYNWLPTSSKNGPSNSHAPLPPFLNSHRSLGAHGQMAYGPFPLAAVARLDRFPFFWKLNTPVGAIAVLEGEGKSRQEERDFKRPWMGTTKAETFTRCPLSGRETSFSAHLLPVRQKLL